MTHYNLVHKNIPMPQAMNIPDAKAAVDKEWKKLEIIPAYSFTKKKAILISVCGRYKLAWKKLNISPTWKILMKGVDLG